MAAKSSTCRGSSSQCAPASSKPRHPLPRILWVQLLFADSLWSIVLRLTSDPARAVGHEAPGDAFIRSNFTMIIHSDHLPPSSPVSPAWRT